MRPVLLLVVLSACGAPAQAPEVTPRSSPATITLTVSSEGETPPGKVVWAWLPEELFVATEGHSLRDDQVADLIQALRVTDPMELTTRASEVGTVDAEGAGGFLVALQPPEGNFWGALFGAPEGDNRLGFSELIRPMSSDPIAVTVRLRAAEARERPERCEGGRRELVVLEDDGVAGEVGNDVRRRLCVVLPPGYAADRVQRYPVVFLLNGYGGDDTVYLHLAELEPEVILVGVDGRTAFGTTYFHDTAYAGAWEGFMARVVAEIDRRYRTVADPRSRALLGHSTGGYNAISLALRRTDLFMAAAASSPDGLDFEGWLFEEGRARPLFLAWTRLEDAIGGAGQMRSYAVQLDDASHSGAIVWPFDLETGAQDPSVWPRWEDATPLVMLEDRSVLQRVRTHLDDRIFISVGREDAFGLYAPAEAFHRRLQELEIAHTWVPTDGGHFEGSRQRREEALAFLLSRL